MRSCINVYEENSIDEAGKELKRKWLFSVGNLCFYRFSFYLLVPFIFGFCGVESGLVSIFCTIAIDEAAGEGDVLGLL